VQGGFFLRKKPLSRIGFGVWQLENGFNPPDQKQMPPTVGGIFFAANSFVINKLASTRFWDTVQRRKSFLQCGAKLSFSDGVRWIRGPGLHGSFLQLSGIPAPWNALLQE